MMRKLSTILGSAVVVLGICATSFGGSLAVDTDILSNLLGGTPVAVTDLMVSPVVNSVVQSEVYSRVYTRGGSDAPYVYLYQLNNTGTVAGGAHSLERITFNPMWGASEANGVGYLSSLDGVDGFLAGGELPESMAYLTDPGDTLSPELSFNFRKWKGYQIDPGEHTSVLYVVSPNMPDGTIGVNVIDGLVAAGFVHGPSTMVPEPNTIILLFSAIGLAFAGRFRR